MAHAASQLKKKADENLAAEDEKEKEKEKKRARRKLREVKKKVKRFTKRRREGGMGGSVSLGGIRSFSFVMMQPPLLQ